jgi:hypothetical protein
VPKHVPGRELADIQSGQPPTRIVPEVPDLQVAEVGSKRAKSSALHERHLAFDKAMQDLDSFSKQMGDEADALTRQNVRGPW